MYAKNLVDEIGQQLHEKLDDIVKKNNIIRESGNFEKIVGWYDNAKKSLDSIPQEQLSYMPDPAEMFNLAYEATQGRDDFLSKVANIMVKKIIEHVRIPFVELTLDEVRVRTEGKQKSVELDKVEAKLRPIKPVVEIEFEAFGVPEKTEIKFQIGAEVKIPKMGFYSDGEEAEIKFGKMVAIMNLSLIETDVNSLKIKSVKSLGDGRFSIDLKGHRFSRWHSKECPHCGTANPADANFCGECGKGL